LRGSEVIDHAAREKGEDVDEEKEESSREWLERRHLGRKMQFFRGKETWEGAKGTEGSRL